MKRIRINIPPYSRPFDEVWSFRADVRHYSWSICKLVRIRYPFDNPAIVRTNDEFRSDFIFNFENCLNDWHFGGFHMAVFKGWIPDSLD